MSGNEKVSTTARLRARVDRLRDENAAVRRERAAVEAAPLPRAEIRAAAEARVAKIAARWRPSAGSLARGATTGDLALQDPLRSVSEQQATEGLLARLFPEQIVELLLAEEERALEGRASGLPAAERPAKLEALSARLFELEQQEEALITDAESAGITIERRPDADAVAVLGLTRAA